MKLERLKLENFMGWVELDIDLSKYSGVLAVMGCIESDLAHSNGTGKSSLITGINYSLYGSAVGKNLDGMIHQECGVPVDSGYKTTLTFSHKDAKYEIIRRKKTGSAQKTTFKDITNDKPMTLTPEEFLCMPEVVWQNTVYSAQGNLSAFVDKLPSARKDILTEIFGMNNYLDLETKARQLAAKSETDMGNITHAVARAQADLESLPGTQADVDNADAEIVKAEAAEAELSKQITEAAVLIASLTEKTADADRIDKEIREADHAAQILELRHFESKNRYERELNTIDQNIAGLEDTIDTPPDPAVMSGIEAQIAIAESTRPALEGKRAEHQAIDREIVQANSQQRQYIGEATALNKKLANIPSGKCPLCGVTMTEEHLNEYRDGLTTEISNLDQAVKEQSEIVYKLSINLQNIGEEIAKLSAIVNSVSSLSRDLIVEREKKDSHEYAVKKLQTLMEQKEKVSTEYLAVINDMVAAVAAAKEMVALKRKSMPVVDEIAEQKVELSKLHDTLIDQRRSAHATLGTYQNARSRATYNLEQKDKIQQNLAQLEQELKDLTRKHNVNTELVKAFGPTGIPTLILENYLSELQQYLDHYMGILSDGKIHVTFQTVKTNTTTAKTSETLNIMVSDINGERDIALYSGGETVRIYLAIRLALAKLLYLKSGHKLGLMIIDELAYLDDAGLMAFVDLLKRIEPEFEQILLVSHLPELKNAFENALVLSRDIEGKYVPQA
jgi:DNA repair exonuclease SbcCD ATPase subunit